MRYSRNMERAGRTGATLGLGLAVSCGLLLSVRLTGLVSSLAELPGWPFVVGVMLGCALAVPARTAYLQQQKNKELDRLQVDTDERIAKLLGLPAAR